MFNSLFNVQSEADLHCLMYISFEKIEAVVWYSSTYGNRSSPDGHQRQLDLSTAFEICMKFGDLISPSIDWTAFKFNFSYIEYTQVA